MKILQLRFKNLNSLEGEWLLDFENREFAADGIFLISGPTGAGKTTILDAIALALYGATPRLGKITANSNEIMSRRMGDCFAELTFEASGEAFRCRWEQRKSHKKADGNLQQPRHEIADARTGNLLESGPERTREKISDLLRLDFGQFKRAIMLAQGEFSAFLKAKDSERAIILEKITGTGIYSDISAKIYKMTKECGSRIEEIEKDLRNLDILSEADEEALRQKQSGLIAECEKSEKLIGEYGQAINWRNNLENLERECGKLANNGEKLARDILEFKAEIEKLERAKTAQGMDALFARYSSLRDALEKDAADLESEKHVLDGLKGERERLAKDRDAARAAMEELEKNGEKLKPQIKMARSLDSEISQMEKSIEDAKKRFGNDEADLRKMEAEERNLLNCGGEYSKKLAALGQWLEANQVFSALGSELPALRGAINEITARKGDLKSAEKDLQKARDNVAAADKNLEMAYSNARTRRELLEQMRSNADAARKAWEKALAGHDEEHYQKQREVLLLKKAELGNAKSLEDMRQKLQPGRPCPLCGSADHPYVLHSPEAPDAINAEIRNLDKLLESARENRKRENDIREEMEKSLKEGAKYENLLTGAENDKKHALLARNEKQEIVKKLVREIEARENDLRQKTGRFGLDPLECGFGAALKKLEAKAAEWAKNSGERDKLNTEIAANAASLDTLANTLREARSKLENSRQFLAKIEMDLLGKRGERRAKFGEMNPDREEDLMETRLKDARRKEADLAKALNERENSLGESAGKIKNLEARIGENTPMFGKERAAFVEKLAQSPFASESDFLAARLPSSEMEKIDITRKRLESARQANDGALKSARENLAAEKARDLSPLSLRELEKMNMAASQEKNRLLEESGKIKGRLEGQELAKARGRQKKEELARESRDYQRYKKLNQLIGSAKGDVFRQMAQNITFEIMLNLANEQLRKMTDRYLLLPNSKNPLDLVIMDIYQGGEKRSAANLSGGESFIASLALALGLSRMASKNARVDSLFLDEGFGTLDGESLETALDTLASLRNEGKMIGVISHVPALGERINARIEVIPENGGRSVIAGPGCGPV